MQPPVRTLPSLRLGGSSASRCFASSVIHQGGRTAQYRRIGNLPSHSSSDASWHNYLRTPPLSNYAPAVALPLQANPLTHHLLRSSFSTSRQQAVSFRELRQDGKAKPSPAQESSTTPLRQQQPEPETPASEPSEPSEAERIWEEYERSQKKSRAKSKARADERAREREEEDANEEEPGGSEQKKRKEEAPPPPHGTKSPWQVFTDTLKTEFKASKEWNESTKALSAGAHQFTENESVRKAREAYTAASSAATSGTASALKNTGKALGQGAAWTWDTTVVKGVRSGVNATGSAIDSATKPVRDTKVYKSVTGSVKDVIDDGSSSKYGGWVEKEERRKQRELRELQGASRTDSRGRKIEKMEEDPEYVHLASCAHTLTLLTPSPAPAQT